MGSAFQNVGVRQAYEAAICSLLHKHMGAGLLYGILKIYISFYCKLSKSIKDYFRPLSSARRSDGKFSTWKVKFAWSHCPFNAKILKESEHEK